MIVRPLGAIAQQQLTAWQEYAKEWDVYRSDDNHVRCVACDQSIIRLTDRNGVAYKYTREDQWALIVAHIRQAHQDTEREVYEKARIADGGIGNISAGSDNPADS